MNEDLATLRSTDVVDRARSLVPVLAERRPEAERLRRLPDATIDDLAAAELFEILVPAARGGHELDVATLFEVGRVLSEGCTSTGWITVFFGLHNWLFALFPEEAQDEVFADRPWALAPGTFAPTGTAHPAAGGYRVSGRWSWGTGVMHSDWVMVGAPVARDDVLDIRLLLLPIGDVAVDDVWHTSGMRGTGSNDVVVDDAFVPEHRTISFFDLVEGRAPGAALHEAPLYRMPLAPVLALGAAAPALGTASSVVAAFRDRVAERVIAYSGVAAKDQPASQIRLANALADVHAAELVHRHAVETLTAEVARGPLPRADRARFRSAATHVVQLSRGVVTDLCAVSGGSAHRLDSPFQAALRDVSTLAGHVVFDPDATAELVGRAALGLPLPITAMV